VGIDRPDDPDDPDVPPDDPSDPQSRRPPPETRYRQDYDADLRAACAAQERTDPPVPSEPEPRSKPADNNQVGTTWQETADLSRWMWTEHKRRWPPEERPPPDRSTDPPGSWRGEGDRYLNPADNTQIEAACDRIADLEREKITPALRAIESQDPRRHLVGLKNCLKGRDRIKEKVSDNVKALTISADEAFSSVPDTVRYTFQYSEAQYTRSVRSDITLLEDQGFMLDKLRNSWSSDHYKGINSQWIEPGTGQRFEVQFHTHISFEAKQRCVRAAPR
jgi:hypothetical protein